MVKRGNPLGWFLGIALVVAIVYIIISLMVENAHLQEQLEDQKSRYSDIVTQKRGVPGEDGESAYEIAVRHGFVGTEEDWLASLKGEPGAAGTNGVDGRNGSTGAAGRNGANGFSVQAPVCVGGTAYHWYLSNGSFLGSTKAICLP